ncbi:MAG: Periplasmic dipeptide transport protein [Paracidovorax wautersii]|uniref:Periplasmic dipeptide transport protein n=1 Tax=Paracidovorax wautersii TaxID=1177982 RepID=A0A7V8FRY8_9BURK|nr:MAG: Periplasmic dipeptide transport protein [Paracidovorax wautersii]
MFSISPLRRVLAVLASAAAALLPHLALAQQSGQALTWVVDPEPSSLVPLVTTAGGNTEIGPKVVEGLLTYDRQLQPRPLLATEWTVSPDGLRYSFKLRQGVKWHDGQPFTSANVVYSIQTLKQAHPRGRVTFANVTAIKAPAPDRVELELSKPAPYLLTALASAESPIVPRHLYEGTDVAANPYNSKPVGTGPFVFKEWVRGSFVRLERNPDYWGAPKPAVQQVVVRFIPDAAARAAALESGEVLLGSQAIPLADVERFRKLPNVEVDTRDWPYVGNHVQIYFNLDTPEFKDRAVRLAVAQSVNVAGLIKSVWYGLGTPSASPIGKANPFHDASIQPYGFDIKAAEAGLDAAGYPRRADGTRFAVRLLYNPFVDRRAADYVRQALGRIGIKAEVQSYDFGTYVTKAYTDRAFDIVVENMTNLFDPTLGVQRIFWSKNFKIGLPSNAPHYVSPEADRLLEAAAVEPDAARRKQLFSDFQKVVHADVPSIEIGANPTITVANRRIKDYAPGGEGIRGSFADVTIAPAP